MTTRLTILRKPRLLVEAKGLGEVLTDRKWISQILSYATVAGIEWCVLTDGDEYRFYNSTAPVDAEEKLFCRIRLTQFSDDEAAKVLGLISRDNMEGNILDDLWQAHFVDRRVKAALLDIFGEKDRKLIRLIQARVPRLTPREINDSLQRLDLRLDSAVPSFDPTNKPKKNAIHVVKSAKETTSKYIHKSGESKRKKAGKTYYGITLKKIVDAGMLKPPLQLFRKTLGVKLEATLLPDANVEVDGKRFESCSSAAEFARSKATGRIMNTNGWSFWQLIDGGKKKTLLDVRTEFIAKNGVAGGEQ